ncbi:MAG: GDP-perosamine synthase [Pseudomonadales bacterium]|nr:GDP-perosamine synthase [Pseudomonadales bacterium]
MNAPAIRLIRPYISFDEVETDFRNVFESGIFTRGPYVEEFRSELAVYTGARHAFLTTSATTALWVCLKLLGIGPGDEVVVSDFSFPATANVVEDLGARPIFADVSLETFNMLPEELERRISARTKAVIFVDAFGNPTGLSRIKAICEHHGLPLIEDAACAIGSSENGFRCGGIADLTCFSFHPRKLLTTGEGGAITTNRDDWAAWLEMKLAHGARGTKGPGLDFVDYGYNFRMSELQAVMGRKQLAKLEAIVDERNAIRGAYAAALAAYGFEPQHVGAEVRHNVQSLVFRVGGRCDRDRLIAGLRSRGVEATIGTYALSATTYHLHRYHDTQPNAAKLDGIAVTLPCYSGIDVGRVVSAICEVMNV